MSSPYCYLLKNQFILNLKSYLLGTIKILSANCHFWHGQDKLKYLDELCRCMDSSNKNSLFQSKRVFRHMQTNIDIFLTFLLTHLLQNTICPVLANSVDPDQLKKPTDLDLHFFLLNMQISFKNPDQVI